MAEAHPERVDPEVVGQLGIASGDVAGHALGEAEPPEQAQRAGQPLLAVQALLFHARRTSVASDPPADVARARRRLPVRLSEMTSVMLQPNVSAMPYPTAVSRDIDAPAHDVFALVSDLTRMGEWSPENSGGTWIKGSTGPGWVPSSGAITATASGAGRPR